MQRINSSYSASTANVVVIILFLIGAVGAHGHSEPELAGNHTALVHESDHLQSYFTLPNHQGLIYGHISLMIIAWVVVLPVGELTLGEPFSDPKTAEGEGGISNPFNVHYLYPERC